MRGAIGIGNTLWRRGGGINWSSYWLTRNPSGLTATTANDTQINLVWTNNGTADYTGHKIYMSSDNGVTYLLKGTVASIGTTYSATGLTKDVLYYFYVVAYKGSSEGSHSNIVSEYAGLWYLAGGVDPSNVLGAWKAQGAASKAASLVNLATPGTNDLGEVGTVQWNEFGWSGFSDANYLTGPVYKNNTYSFNAATFDPLAAGENLAGRVFSAEPDNGTTGVFLMTNSTDNVNGYMRRGAGTEYVAFTEFDTGVAGINQAKGFVNGVAIGNLPAAGFGELSIAFTIGRCSFSIGAAYKGCVRSLVVYKISITDAQMIAVQNRMAFGVPAALGMRDFSGAVRYVNNPVIPHNTEVYNVKCGDAPYIRIENEIEGLYYAGSQVSPSWANYNIAIFTSPDLLTWTPIAENPVLLARPGEWDEKVLLHPSIKRIGTEWYMYYSGRDAGGVPKIGLAKSPDMITWTRYGNTPIYANQAELPCVVLIGSTYFMYYFNGVYKANSGLICYATSSDGITWTYGGICFPITATDFFFNYWCFDPFVIQRSDGIYEMVFSRGKSSGGIDQDLCYAASYNGITWFVYQAVIFPNNADVLEAGYLGDPVLLDAPNGQAYLYYAGIETGATPDSSGMLAII